MRRLLPLLFFVPPSTAQEARVLFEDACIDCHDATSVEGGFNLEYLLGLEEPVTELYEWRRAKAMVELGAMPPREELDAATRRALLDHLAALEADALAKGGGAGYEPLRRLTRGELENCLRDLLGVEVDLAQLLPGELVSEGGFRASSSTLFVHADWLERAGAAARLALLEALPDEDLPEEGTATLDGEPEVLLPRLLRRAYRRQPTAAERDAVLERFQDLDAELPTRAALRETLAVVLTSPHFLMRAEDTQAEAGAVSPFALASRLSFFLWASAPDDWLLDLAEQGRLAEPKVLDAQVRRMLADERALSLGEEFAGRWLAVDGLGTLVKPDPIDVPFMTDSVMASMREELARFFHALVVEELPLESLLEARFSFVDEELAAFYGIRGVEGDEHRRVSRMPDARRGLLGKAAVLATTAYPDRTSPVLRGNWVLTNLLGTPPPPPPPGASEFEEELFEELEDPSTRELLAAHRRDPSCAACHDRIDPLGIALEGFDRYGRLRRRDDEGKRIDARGELPGGIRFDGPAGLRDALVEHRGEELSLQAARRMLAYALGRPLTWRDERTVVELAAILRQDGWGALVRGVVASRPFRYQEPETR